ncbi:MAG: polysaccharide deacetylase family protein [Oscillospiraceae bacterium]|nr:polysaccharide deacetylase family protein [Oscillospiraceae bacterium]
MRAITFTKKQIKRAAAVAALAVATAAVAVTATVTSVKTRAVERRLPIYCVERGDKKIALTFDVAWENSNTQQLIDILAENNARATFFVTGDWCDRYPDDVKMFYDAGHEIENHSDKHPHVEGINVNDLINDTKECSRKIKMITGEEPKLYRAPYGEYDDSLITTLDGMGMKVIQWDVDSVDWKKPSADKIKKKVLKGVKSGSILLFHNDLENTTEALPDILKSLRSQGYEFVGVEDMIYFDNYTIDATGKQIPTSQSSINLSEEKIEAVIAQYSDKISAAGITDEQLAAAIAAIKSGNLSALPAELRPLAAEVMASINGNSQNPPDSSDITENSSTSGTTSTDPEMLK